MKRVTGAGLLAGVEVVPTIRVADAHQIELNWAKTFANGRRHAEAAAREFNRIGLPKDLLR